jgi:hypothetical protein
MFALLLMVFFVVLPVALAGVHWTEEQQLGRHRSREIKPGLRRGMGTIEASSGKDTHNLRR